MLPYLAFSWDARDAVASAAATSFTSRCLDLRQTWSLGFVRKGFAVCHAAEALRDFHKVYKLTNSRGIVLGRLFETEYVVSQQAERHAPRDVEFGAEMSDAIVSSGGTYLTERFWGEYVSFFGTEACQYVVRDASGRVPCQMSRVGKVNVYFMRIEDLEVLQPVRFSIDPDFLAAYLAFDGVAARNTGLRQVQTVLPGERVSHHVGRRIFDFVWNPLRIAESNAVEDAETAVLLIRKTVRACVSAYASCFDDILIQLSGGLDSSIVSVDLRAAPNRPRVRCRHVFSADAASDERYFARAVAAHLGLELVEVPIINNYTKLNVSDIAMVPMPYPWWLGAYNTATDPVDVDLCRGVEAMFSGDGGDEVFYNGGPIPTAVDHAWKHGITKASLSAALDDAVAQNVSIWAVLRLVYRYGIRRKPFRIRDLTPPGHMNLMNPAVRGRALFDRSLWHPLYGGPSDIAPAKFAQAYSFTFGSTHVYRPTSIANPIASISPLQSQPMLELGLRIALYLTRLSGRNRGLARSAFSKELPVKVINRIAKSGGNSDMQSFLNGAIREIRDLLLDGYLTREGVVDRVKLEAALSRRPGELGGGIVEICKYLSVEGWAARFS